MIRIGKYKLHELESELGSRGKQAVIRKLNSYDVEFSSEGRGRHLEITITAINNPFKVYCITELGFNGQTDFVKLRDFYYCYLNCDEFMSMPDEVKESRMRKMGYTLSRQTIANYISKLDRKGYIHKSDNDYYYYFACEESQIMTDASEYKKAWAEAFDRVENQGCYWNFAIYCMIEDYGGVARKQPKTEINAIYRSEIEYINDLIFDSMKIEMREKFKSDI